MWINKNLVHQVGDQTKVYSLCTGTCTEWRESSEIAVLCRPMGTFILCSRYPLDRYTSCVCSYMCCFCVNVLPLTSVWCQPHPHIHSPVNVVTSVSLCHQQNGHQVGWRMCLEQVYILCCKLAEVIEWAIALIPSCFTIWYLVPRKFIEVLRTFI